MLLIRFVIFLSDALSDFLSKNCPYISGAISFYFLFSFFPLVLGFISIMGYLSGSEEQQVKLADTITSIIPVSQVFVSDLVGDIVSSRALTGITGLIALFWASTAAFGAIRKGINSAWGINKTRPFIEERIIDFSLVLGAGLMLMFILFIPAVLAFGKEIIDVYSEIVEIDFELGLFWQIIERLVIPILTFITFLSLYKFLPNTQVRFSDVWSGALFSTVAFEIAKLIVVWYVGVAPIYNTVYGTVGAIMALMAWVYISALILLFGALISSRIASHPSRIKGDNVIKIVWYTLTCVRLRVKLLAEQE